MLVTVPDEEFGHVELLLGLTPTPLVDTILVGASVLPLRAGTGPADTREVAERIVGAWTRQEPAALCALYDPALAAAAAALFDRDCRMVRGSTNVRRVVVPALEGWSADGTAVVAVSITQSGETLTMHHVVTPGPTGFAITGVYVDFDEQVARLLRPI